MLRIQSLDGVHAVDVEPDFGVGRVVAEAHGVPQGRDPHDISCNHTDRSIQLHDAKMALHGLLHKGYNISLLSLMGV